MDKQRIKEIDIMRGIAIILVILGHAIIVYPIDLHEIPWCEILFTWLSSVHMPLFFLLAGFCYSFREKPNKSWWVSYGTYLLKKVKRIVVPYFVFCILDMSVRVIFPESVNNKWRIIESLENMILRGGEYWFLYVLFFMFVIFPLMEKVLKKSIMWILLLGALLVLRFSDIAPGVLEINSVVMYLPYFIFGYLVKVNWRNIRSYKKTIVQWRLVIFIVSSAVWAACVGFLYLKSNWDAISFVASVAGIMDVWLIAIGISNKKMAFLCDCSKYSLQLYLLNGYFLVVSRTVIVSFLGAETAALIIVFNMLMTLILPLLIIKYLLTKIEPARFLMGIE